MPLTAQSQIMVAAMQMQKKAPELRQMMTPFIRMSVELQKKVETIR